MMGSEHPRPEPADTWRQHAACATADPDLFYPTQGENHKGTAAKAICATCPVADQCLEEALARPIHEDFGVWGGTSEKQRREIRKRRGLIRVRPEPQHGEPAMYGRGCRCAPCRAANTAYRRPAGVPARQVAS